MKHHNINKSGFTIIEVSLVLAIAGLIIVMVFIALPALQRQSRDAKRKEDTLTFIEAIKKYQQNNHGTLPNISDQLNWTWGADGQNSIAHNWGEVNTWDDDVRSRSWPKFYLDYLGENFKNPEGEKYSFLIVKNGENWNYNEIAEDSKNFSERWADWYVFIGATCNDGKPVDSNNPRNLAILVSLESTEPYCANS